jgi:hypothetical protein
MFTCMHAYVENEGYQAGETVCTHVWMYGCTYINSYIYIYIYILKAIKPG